MGSRSQIDGLICIAIHSTITSTRSGRGEVQVDYTDFAGPFRGRYTQGIPKAEMIAKGPRAIAPNHDSRFGRDGGVCILLLLCAELGHLHDAYLPKLHERAEVCPPLQFPARDLTGDSSTFAHAIRLLRHDRHSFLRTQLSSAWRLPRGKLVASANCQCNS